MVLTTHGYNFNDICEYFLHQDKKAIEAILVQNRRIAMLHDLDYLYEVDGTPVEAAQQFQRIEDFRHLRPDREKPALTPH